MEQIVEYADIKVNVFQPWLRHRWFIHGVTVKDNWNEPGESALEYLGEQFRTLGIEETVGLTQVHGKTIVPLNGRLNGIEADGWYGSYDCSAAALISVADCVPVFILSVVTGTWALLHSGWRGTAQNICGEAIDRLVVDCEVDPEELQIYLGPSISGKYYEVGLDVLGALKLNDESPPVSVANGQYCVDLRKVIADQAIEKGVERDNVNLSRFCTWHDNDKFCSFRREGKQSLRRMWAFMAFNRLSL